ncbi:hypothetical protein L209DRAFT_668771, partial [Thermothelomyces heterothallicus CBS 203.75]
RRLDDEVAALARPVLDLIVMQSWAPQNMRAAGVVLELHWIPGHGHHQWADELAKGPRAPGLSFSSQKSGCPWYEGGEPCCIGLLRRELEEAA